MTLEEKLEHLRLKLEKEHQGLSKSMYKNIDLDMDSFNNLVSVIGRDDLQVVRKESVGYPHFVYSVDKNIDLLEILADEVIKMFKDMNFYCYLKRGYAKISLNEKREILTTFLNDLSPTIYDLYKNLYQNGYVFSAEFSSEFGESFIMPYTNNYFLGINQCNNNDIFELETYVHELLHIYSHKFLSNYRSTTIYNTLCGFYLETIPLYGELVFNEWMINNNIYVNDVEFHRNILDYFFLQFFKTVKYLAEMLKREDVHIVSEGYNYTVYGNNRLLIDDGVPFFQYHKELSSDSLSDFQYSIGSLDAYELLKRERAGENSLNIINEYLISLQNINKFREDFEKGYDFNFINKEISKRLELLKNKYPIPGYIVNN